ncbi:hypothetical protein [Micromonospora chalcea]|uniref:hypothetical protein n=1 Tax=Micromonospora chalcea TaxID=1874 RepID=UPI003D721186
MITEAEARKIIGVDGAQALVKIVGSAWKRFLDEGIKRSPTTRAGVVWDYMVEAADQHLLGKFDGVQRVMLDKSPAYVLRNRVLLRFKKHDRAMLTRNIPTELQRRIAQNGFFDGMPGLAVLTCGYILDKAEAGIEKIVAVRSIGGTVDWHIDLPELASGVLAPLKPIIPNIGGSEEVASLPSIARVARKEDGDGAK